jgi:hypothetical protein
MNRVKGIQVWQPCIKVTCISLFHLILAPVPEKLWERWETKCGFISYSHPMPSRPTFQVCPTQGLGKKKNFPLSEKLKFQSRHHWVWIAKCALSIIRVKWAIMKDILKKPAVSNGKEEFHKYPWKSFSEKIKTVSHLFLSKVRFLNPAQGHWVSNA